MTDPDNHPRPPLTRVPVFDAMADAYARLGVDRQDLRARARGETPDPAKGGNDEEPSATREYCETHGYTYLTRCPHCPETAG